jgi:PAP2 superfamily
LPAGGLTPPRHYAMLHVEMFDAVNSIEKCHRPFRFKVKAHPSASPEAAAAQAAHDLLVAQFPASKDTFDAALAARLEGIAPFAARHGTQVGRAIAEKVIEWRANDGWNDPAPPYSLPPFPGQYQTTPPAFAAPQFAQFAHTEPFALLTPTLFLSTPPPTVNSESYAASFNEVKAVGSVTSTVRTAEQTQLARLFASVTSRTIHWGLWNHVARDTARDRSLTLLETARLYALMNVSIHDGLQTSQTGKFIYGYWRPVTGIRRADEDLNPQTAADASWTPLLTTPPYPSYPGNQACVGASAARALALFYGTDAVPFTAFWLGNAGNPDVSRPYQSFWQMALDQANSRVYGGIHWRFDNEVSQQSCVQVPQFVFTRFMQPR